MILIIANKRNIICQNVYPDSANFYNEVLKINTYVADSALNKGSKISPSKRDIIILLLSIYSFFCSSFDMPNWNLFF